MDGKKDVKTIRLVDGKPWTCENGHLLGVMRRERIARGKAKGYRLYLLRNAEAQMPDNFAPLAWIGRLEGTMRNIQCSCCGAEKTWWANKAATEGLLRSTGIENPEKALDDARRKRAQKELHHAERA